MNIRNIIVERLMPLEVDKQSYNIAVIASLGAEPSAAAPML
ncbi:unnamed protein product [Colias eurytheme]|nr:unnamed protein product [Colias eurytheme]